MALFRGIPICHILAVMLGSLEVMLFGGVIFGWHSVVYIYKDVGYFEEGCGMPETWQQGSGSSVPFSSMNPGNSSTVYKPLTDADDTDFSSVDGTYLLTTSSNTSFDGSSTASYKGDHIHKSSIRFDQLTCEEQTAVRAEEGGSSRVCDSQDKQFLLIFSLATGINGMLSFPSGILYDRLGTRFLRIVAILCFMGAQFCLIFASSGTAWLLYPGFIALVYGGYQILLTNLQLSGLIPSLRSTIMSLYAGSYDTSSAIFLLFKAAYHGGVSINTSFAIHASLFFVIFTSSTFFLLPRMRIPNPLPPTFRLRCSPCKKFCKSAGAESKEVFTSKEWKVDPNGSIILVTDPVHYQEDGNDTSGLGADKTTPGTLYEFEVRAEEEQLLDKSRVKVVDDEEGKPAGGEGEVSCTENEGKDMQADTANLREDVTQSSARQERKKTFKQVVFSSLFLTDLMWMSFQRLRSWIFVGMFNPWITRLACGDKAVVSHYTSVYAGLQFFGILTAPLSGCLMDRKIKGAEKYGNPRYERLHASIASFVLDSAVSVVLTIGTLIPVLEVQYAVFVLHCLHRSFLYGPNSAFVANAFPNEHFGKLFGITLTVSALFSCVQYPLFLIMQGPLKGDPVYINVFLLILMLASFLHPFNIWRYLKKKAAAAEEAAQSQ